MIVPVNLIDQWKNELLSYMSESILTDKDICVIKSGSLKVTGKICIVAYSMVEKLVNSKKISSEQFGVVIADESHNIKNIEAKRTAVVLPFLRDASVSICLTGTPLEGKKLLLLLLLLLSGR